MKLTTELIREMYKSAGYRERSILNDLAGYQYRPENGYHVFRLTDRKGKSCEYSAAFRRWTN